MTQQTEQAKMLMLCLLTTECSACKYSTLHDTYWWGIDHPQFQHIYLLDPEGKFGLRVKCGHGVEIQQWSCWPCREDCDLGCQGRGWTPATDPWLYMRAAWHPLLLADHRNYQRILEAMGDAFENGTGPGEAVFKVVAEALLKGEA